MAVTIRTGHAETDDGLYRAAIEWKMGDNFPTRLRLSPETYETATEAIAKAERMAAIFGRMLDANGYTKTMAVPTN